MLFNSYDFVTEVLKYMEVRYLFNLAALFFLVVLNIPVKKSQDNFQ